MPRLLVLALAVLSAASRTEARQAPLPDRVDPTNPSPIPYVPAERVALGPPAPEQYVNVFLPPGTAPPGGWPVVLATGYGGGVATPPVSLLGRVGPTSPLHALLAEGIAIVSYGVPGIGAGAGLWYPPGHPSGRWESFAPADDNPEKSAIWAIQWVKSQTTYPFDLNRLALRGSSGGAVLAIRAAMGPDRAAPNGSLQVRQETRVRAILAIQPPTSVWALRQGPELTLGLPTHLEQAARPGIPAETLDQVDGELQKDYSLMREAFSTPEARANNASQALCLVYGDPVLRIAGQVATFDLDASGFPLLHDAIQPPFQHDSWFGYVFFKTLLELSPESAAFHARESVFAMARDYALPPPFDYHTVTYSGTFDGPEAQRIGHEWLVSKLLGTPPPPPPTGSLADGSFENQAPGGPPGSPWTSIGGGGAIILGSQDLPEAGFPSRGNQWLELDGTGTAAAIPPSAPGSITVPPSGGRGISQSFRFDPLAPWLQFEAAFLPGTAVDPSNNDWLSVDVSDGTSVWNLHYQDSLSPLPMSSARFGGARTATRTVTANLSERFPAADAETVLTLTVQIGNGGDGTAPPRAWIDGFRLLPGVSVLPLGCGVNPSGSTTILSGTPSPGATLILGIDDPTGHFAPGSIPVLALSAAPAPGFPCGPVRSGYGLSLDSGELLFHPGKLLTPLLAGPTWTTPEVPAAIPVPIPADPGLVGAIAYVQGLLFDPSRPSGAQVGLGEAYRFELTP